ncbi:MAG: CCA tRNA nucleotidyltransferase [Syntrophomonadaceae bacterium]
MIVDIPKNVRLILDKLYQKDYQAYVYGACIRDLLLGKEPINWDITTDALPPDIVTLFDGEGFNSIPDNHDYCSVLVVYGGQGYKVGTFQTGKDRRFTNDIKEALLHNDFTMNAVAYNDRDGVIDPYNGIEDIHRKLLRCPGNAVERIKEDSTRILRAIRFEAQLGFEMDEALLDAIAALKDTVPVNNSERVCNELTQIFLSYKPSVSIRRMLRLGLLERLIPELMPTIGFDTKSSYHDLDVFEHSLVVMDYTKPSLSLRLAALFHDIAKPNCLTVDEQGEGHCYGHAQSGAEMARNIMVRLGFDRKTIEAVTTMINEHMNNYESTSDLSIKRLARRVGVDNIDNLFELQMADIKGSDRSGKDPNRIRAVRNKCWEVISRREPLSTRDLEIDGYDLMGLGYPQGKEIGAALEYLLDFVVDNPSLNKKDILIGMLKNRK